MGNEEYHIIFENSSQPSLICDVESGLILDANIKVQQLLRTSKKELLNSSLVDFFPKQERENYILLHQKMLKNKHLTIGNLFLINRAGKKIEVEIESTKFISENKEILQLIVFDKESDYSSREYHPEIHTIFKNLPDIYLRILPDGKITDYETKNPDNLYLNPEEFMGKRIQDIMPIHIARGYNNALIQLKQNQDLVQFEYSLRQNNVDKYFEARLFRLLNEQVVAIIRDISDSQNYKTALADSERLYKLLFEHAPIGLGIINENNELAAFNETLLKQGNYSEEDIQSIIFFKHLPVDENDAQAIIDKFDKTGSVFQHELKLRRKDGSTYTALLSINKIILSGKELRQVMIEDITESKQAVDLLKTSEEKFHKVFNSASDAIILLKNNKIIDCNKMAVALLKLTKEEIINSTAERKSDNKNSVIIELIDIIKNQKTDFKPLKLFPWTFKRNDGKKLLTEISSSYFELNNDYYLEIFIRDLTSRNATEKALKENRRILEVLMNNLPGMAYRCLNDENWTIKFASKGCFKLTGYKDTDFINNKKIAYADIIHEDDRDFVYDAVQKALKQQKPFQITYRIITKSKEIKYVWEQGEGIFDENGDVLTIEGFISDTSDEVAARSALQQSEYKFRSLVEKSIMGVYIIQEDKFAYVNPIFTRIFGYSSTDEIYTYKIKDLVYGKDKEKVLENIRKRIDNEIETIQYSFIGLKKDNTTFIAEVTGSRTIYNGKPAVIGTLMDITERIKKEQELKDTEERFRLLVDTMLDGTLIIDMEGKILFANNAALNIVGLSNFNSSIEMNIKDFVQADFKNIVDDEINLIKKRKENSLSEYKIKTIKGIEKWVESLATRFNFKGTPSILVTIRDISERKSSQEEISLLNFALHSAANSIVITDKDGNIIWANNAFTKLTGYQLKEISGKNTRLLKSGLTEKHVYIDLWNTISAGKVWRGDLINRRKDGTIYNEEMTVTPVNIPSSNKKYYIAVKQNITERKIIEDELRGAKERAEEMNRLKSNFLANMSHELRTPLVGILGFAEMLNEELKNQDLKDMSNSILSSGRRLMGTLNYILDLSKIESNKVELTYKEILIGDAIKEIVKSFRAVAEQKGLYFKLLFEHEDYAVKLDEQLLRGIINNLINNALKFTHQGGITIEIYRKLDYSKSYIVIAVKDTGIGIPDDKLQLIFEEFRQVSEGLDRNYEGTGLGLTITKKFVEMLDGNITVESIEGEGSTFTVTFPEIKKIEQPQQIEEPDKIETSTTESQSLKKQKILLVENDEASINVSTTFLKEFCILDIAKDGNTALKKARNQNYAAIIMDIDLGWGMNGMEVTQEIRKMEEYKNIPIIAVTAYAMQGDKEAFLNAGCTHYLAKPFDKKSITRVMQEALESVHEKDTNLN